MDYYKILGIEKKSSAEEIKKAYRRLAMKWHPDKNPNNKDVAENKFKEISEAYSVLKDKEKREIYNKFGKNGLKSRGGFRSGMSPNNIFRNFFGTNNVFHANRNRHQTFTTFNFDGLNNKHFNIKKKKGRTIEYKINCTLEDLYHGTTKRIKIENSHKDLVLEVEIFPGWKEGTKITFSKMGFSTHMTTPGDIVFVIIQLDHEVFSRQNNDLVITQKISLDMALNGFVRPLKLMNETVHNIKIDKLPNSDYKYIIKNGGMPIRKNKLHIGYGNLIVRFDVLF